MRRIRTSLRLRLGALALATVAATVATGAVFSGVNTASGAPGDAPNVVMVVTDDQRFDSFDARTMPATKKLIADKGATFTDTIITTPTCCPSRATMLTGQYGHNNGVVANAPGYRALVDPENTLPVWLNEAGYQTAHLGKYLNGYQGAVETRTEVAPGWDEWYTLLTPRQYYGFTLGVNGQSEKFGNKPKDHLTRVLNRQTAHVIRRFAGKDDPFYIQLDQFAPHTESGMSAGANRCKGGAVPDPRDDDLFEDVKPGETPNFNEKDVSDKPSFIRDRDRLDADGKGKVAKRLGCRLASLRAVDRGVKKIVKTLKTEQALDDTVIIFVSDNGYFQGEHRISVNKTFPYEEALRVPLAIRVPPGVAGGGGAGEVKKLVSNIDLAPTILDLAGAEPCNGSACRVMDGRSMVPLLKGNGGGFSDDRSLVLEYGRERDKTGLLCEYTGIRNPQHSYVEYTGLASDGGCDPIDERELYPLGSDRFELDNLARGNGSSGAQQELEQELAKLRDCAGIEGRDPAPATGSYCE